ncbi:sensor box histidine kinase [Natronomonas moolapensis 8.8.11]|uniref:Sensor box histidine kinase n=1 Tax=Natronomonas moolapensis (strain DSM 18674 / CECT 7526 / JCM 14361 / 8.8.11) TaxID=268739 RepID=M1XS32_NATM8|nr:PAS domain S-box protein [Natronomonas moolapensis]CCQ37110.1 sensor box histidine kinase [Natronomonas moolapensis 8.8.11]
MSDGDTYIEHTPAGLLELSSELNQAGSTEDVSAVAVRMLDLNFDAPLSAIWKYDEEATELRPIAESSEAQEVIGDAPVLPVDSLAGRAYRQSRPETFDDVHEADATYNSDSPIRSEILVPISEFGVLSVGATEVDAFTEKDSQVAELVASNVETAISRLRQHEELQAERDWTHTLFEGSNDAIFISDADANFVQVNRAACELTGYEREELLSMRIPDLHEEVDLHAYQDYHDRILAGEPATTESRLLRSDGRKIDVEFSNRRIERDGSAYMHTVARDVTEQRERRRRLESFKSAIENASDGIAILDGEAYTYVDQTHTEMYGFEEQSELLGQTWRELYTDAAEIERIEDEALSALQSDGEWRGTVTASPAGKGEFPTELSLTRLEDDRIVCVVRDVSEKHRRQAELRENERRFESVFEDPEMLVGLLETTGELIDVNETALEYVSNDKSDILGEPFWEGEWWSHSSDLQEDLRDWIERAAAGEYVSYQVEHPDQDGDIRFITGTIRPVVGDTGVESLVISGRDITPRERRRRELETFQQAVEDAKDGFAILEDGQYTYVDDTHVEMYGFDDTDQLLGNSWRMLYDEDETERLEADAFPVLESEGHWRGKVTGSRPDGTTFPAEISLTVVDDGPLVCTVRDETARQQRERELELKEQAIDSSNVGVIITDPQREDNPIEYINKGFSDITGYQEADVVGCNPRFLHGPETDPEELSRLREAIAAGEPVTVELKNYRKDGSEYWNRLSVTPVTAADGTLSKFIGIQQDVTARRQRTRSLAEQNRKLELVLSGTDTGIAEWDFATDTISFNQTLIDLFGHDPDDEREFFRIVAPEDRDRVRDLLDRLGEIDDVSVEFRVIDTDGQTRWVHTDAVLRHDEDGGRKLIAIATEITEQKERIRQIQHERKRFEILSESLEEYAFVLLDAEGQIDSWNDGAADIFGYDDEAAIGMQAAELHPEEERKRGIADRLLTQASLGGESTHEGQRVRQDGSSFPAEASYVPLQTEDGVSLGYGMVIRDLSNQRQQRRRTERFVEESVDVVSILDRDGYFTYLSGSAERVLGYDTTRLEQESLFDFVHPEDRKRVMEAFFTAVEDSDSSVQLEFQARDADDEWITVEARGRNLFDDEAIGGFLIYIRDITNIKQQTKKFESVFNQTFQLTGLMNQDGEILELNDPLTEFGGIRAEENSGTPLWECPLFAHSSEVQTQLRQAIDQASSGSFVRFDVEAEGVDGLASFDFSVKPISGQHGEVSFLIFEARDITAQEQRRRHVQVLHRIMRHNIRNDLTKLRGYVDLLESGTDAETREQRAATIRDVLDKWERMADKTQELQSILTSESALASHRSVQQIIEDVQTKKAKQHLNADVTIAADRDIKARIPSDLDKAISELVENAITANDTDQPSVQIGVSQADDQWIEICVSDTGPGLPDMEKSLLETGEETPLSHGQGLGLWMVRALVTRAGGSISVETSRHGSEITLEVPAQPAREDSQTPNIVS